MKSHNKLSQIFSDHWQMTAFAVYLVIALTNILSHELWRDEIQSWMQALASNSFGDLMRNMTFERHPRLWHSSLFLISKLTTNPIAMQFFHLLIAATSVFLILFKSPFEKRYKLLIIFGYFFLYEYAAISRNYAFGILFILAYLTFYERRFDKPVLSGVFLFLMAQTTAFGLLFAMCFAFLYVFEIIVDKRKVTFQYGLWLVIFLAGVFLSFQQLKSPEAGLDNVVKFSFDPLLALYSIDALWKSYVPIPAFSLHYWNSNILGLGLLRVPLAVLLLAASSLFLLRSRRALLFYWLGTAGVFAVMYQYHVFMYLRYSGHLFLFFIAGWWLSHFYEKKAYPRCLKLAGFSKQYGHWYITALLLMQTIAGLSASVMEWITPFSASKAAANYINQNIAEDTYIIGDLDEPASAVSGHSGREIYYPRRHYRGTFIIYRNRDESIKTRQVLEIARKAAQEKGKDILLLLNWQARQQRGLTKIAEFTKSVVPDEIYYLYKLSYDEAGQNGELKINPK